MGFQSLAGYFDTTNIMWRNLEETEKPTDMERTWEHHTEIWGQKIKPNPQRCLATLPQYTYMEDKNVIITSCRTCPWQQPAQVLSNLLWWGIPWVNININIRQRGLLISHIIYFILALTEHSTFVIYSVAANRAWRAKRTRGQWKRVAVVTPPYLHIRPQVQVPGGRGNMYPIIFNLLIWIHSLPIQ